MEDVRTYAEETCPKTNSNTSPLKTCHPLAVTSVEKNRVSDHDLNTSARSDSVASGLDIEKQNTNDEPDFPEGGLQAWLVVFGSWCGQAMIYGIINSTGSFQDYLSDHQLRDYSSAQISWIFSLNLFLVFFCGIQIGPYFDAHGPRILVAVGTSFIVLSVFLLSFCSALWHFILTYSVLGGLGGALLNTPAIASVGHYFKRRRGFATGISLTSGSVGGVIMPLMLQSLIPKIGFAWAARVLALLLLVLAVPANLFIQSRFKKPGMKTRVLPDLTVFKNPGFALATAGLWLMEWGLFVTLAYLSSYATSHGLGQSWGFTVVALMNAGSFFGRFLPGILADRVGRFNVMITTITLCVITIFGLWLPAGGSKALIIAYAVLFGFASGSNLGLVSVCLSQLCRVQDYGRYFATAYTVTSFGSLTSVPIGGAILSAGHGSYTGTILFAGCSYTGAFVCYVIARGLAAGWKARKVF